MAEASTTSTRPGPAGLDPEDAPADRLDAVETGDAADVDALAQTSWSNLWQVPAIIVSALLITLGIVAAMQRDDPPPISALLDHAEALIDDAQFEATATYLDESVKPRLHEAGPADQARFHAIVGDWIALTQESQGVSLQQNNVLIDEQYGKATAGGLPLGATRLERWAIALVELGRLDGARARMSEIEALLASQTVGADARTRRNRVFRRIVQFALEQSEMQTGELLAILDDFRRDSLLGIKDEIWAVARQGELRVDAAMPEQAIDYLLLELRRLEPRVAAEHRSAFGELYVTLGRAYHRAGNDQYARFNLEQSLGHFDGTEDAFGWAHVLLGQIDADHGRFEEALEHYDLVVRNFEAAPCQQPALLGRAEVFSIIGEHEQAMADYRELRDMLLREPRQVRVSTGRFVESLIDRHDASLAMGRLRTALDYLSITEPVYEQADAPGEVLLRRASTARQLADNMIEAARVNADTGERLPLDRVDPAVRYEAGLMYEQAATWAVEHARATRTDADQQELWAESLWLAADSFDQAGLHDQAVTLFREYVATRSEVDPRRPQAMFRLAQTHEALMDYESAAARYQQIIDEHPRSTYATGSFVPLARVLEVLDREPEAEQLLTKVVQGEHVIKPDASDYRDALIQLGSLQYRAGTQERAIEQLTAAARRYPDDPRINEIRFKLADAHRRLALELERLAETDPTLSPAQRQALQHQRTDELEKAQALFDRVVRSYGQIDPLRLNALQIDFNRRAHLYRADCAFLLKDYQKAIALYDEAARRYSDQHSSLVALIQIVNCYYGLNDPQRARTAEQRARVRLKQLPDSAFQAEDALMDRAAWERWLANNPPGESLAAADS